MKDLRDDFVIFIDDNTDIDITPLELDDRKKAEEGERVWLPDKDGDQPDGYTLVEGTVIKAGTLSSQIQLDKRIVLQSQSGTPIISQYTGKVIGLLTWGRARIIGIAPSKPILDAISEEKYRHLLEDVVGNN